MINCILKSLKYTNTRLILNIQTNSPHTMDTKGVRSTIY